MNKKSIDINNSLFDNVCFDMKFSNFNIENKTISLVTFSIYSVFFVVSLIIMGHTCYGYFKDRDNLVFIFHHFVLTVVSLICIIYSYIRRDDVNFLIINVKKSYNYNSPLMISYLNQILKDKEPIMKKIHYSIISFPFYVLLNDALNCFIEINFSDVEYILFFPFYTDLDLTNWLLYFPIIVWQTFITLSVVVVISGIVGVILLIYSHLMVEFSTLEHAIIDLNRRIEEKIEMCITARMPEDMKKNVIEKINKGCIDELAKHLDDIIIYFNKAKGFLYFIYSLIIATGVTITVCTGIIFLSEDQVLRMKFFGIFAVQIIYLYATCWIGESITSKSEKIRILIYDIEWWNYPKSCHMSIRLMLVRLIKPFYFSTIMGQKIRLESFMDMVKGSYSYFNMIIQSQK